MEKRKDYKVLVIVVLLVAVVFMSVGYAALSQTLIVNATANVNNDAKWSVKIVKIEETAKSITPTEVDPETAIGDETTDSAVGTNTATYMDGNTRARFAVTLNAPGDYAEFTVTVKNLGTIDAILNSLSFDEDPDPEQIVYTVTPADVNDASTLAAGNTETYVIRVEWDKDADEMPTVTQKTATLTLDYKQK